MSYLTLKSGMKLYYEDVGEGAAVVMMHGWTSNRSVYDQPVELLKSKARCITYDHRGHGKSREANSGHPDMNALAGDLHELIVTLSLTDITLVGWSMGAGVAMAYIKRYGCAALRQIVLCDMTPKQLNDENWHLGLYKGKFTKEDMLVSDKKDFLSQYRSFAVGAKPSIEKLPAFVLNYILKKRLMFCDENVLKSLSLSMKSQDYRDVMKQITVPCTYFYAVPGSLFSPELAKWYEEHISAPFHAVAFPDSTHLLIDEYPEKFAAEIEKLLPNHDEH